MKKKYYFLLLSFVSSQIAFSQNLVVNPSFEITNTNCSNPFGEGFRSDLNPSWDNANNNIPGDSCSSPDLFSACNPIATGMPDANMFGIGYQYSRTGTRHAGIILYSQLAPFPSDNYREYIQGHTTTPLVAGQTYCVSFHVSLGNGSSWAVENFGLYFSNTHYLRNACTQGSRINVTPQLSNNCGIISDTMEWVQLQWDYTATGGEQYFIIGNFNNDAGTNVVSTGHGGFGNVYAYYFIDDVSIVQNTCCYAELESETFCLSDAPSNLSVSTGLGGCSTTISGTWSGQGITNPTTGTFSPSVAGVGSHTITFTADCGYVTTTTVAVSPCALQVCIETDGSLTASGGVAPYSWSAFQPGGTITITNQAECVSCGYTWQSFIGQCLNGFLPATSCTLSDSWVVYATGTNTAAPTSYPIQIADGGGGLITINSASSLTSCSADPCAGITISASIAPTHVTCTTSGSAIATPSGGTAPYSFSWNTTPPQTNANATNLTAGNYTVTVTDNNNCTVTQSVTINPAASAPTVTITPTHLTCTTSGSAIATPSGGTAPYSFSWNTTPPQTNANATNLTAGTYTVTVTDNNNCTVTQSVTINPAAGAPTVTMSATDTQCTINSGTATASPTGGTTPYSFSWNTTPAQTNQTATGLGVGSYTVTVIDAAGCQTVESVTVIATNAPTINVVASQNVSCFGSTNGTATVNASGGTAPYSYSWNTTPPQTNATATNLIPGTYTATVTDNNGCSNITQVIIGAPAELIVTETVTYTNCGATDGQIALSVTGGNGTYTFDWSPAVSTTDVATGLAIGTYSVVVSDQLGCSVSLGATIVTNVTFGLDAYPNTSIDAGESIVLNIDVEQGIIVDEIIWTPATGLSCTDCASPTATPTETTTYYVMVTDDQGCIAIDSVTIVVLQPCAELFVPTIFSPNSDGLNDLECVMGECIAAMEFTIFNRWGEVVFSADNQADCWDGTFRGKPVQTGVYVYKLKARLSTGEEINLSGNLNVIR